MAVRTLSNSRSGSRPRFLGLSLALIACGGPTTGDSEDEQPRAISQEQRDLEDDLLGSFAEQVVLKTYAEAQLRSAELDAAVQLYVEDPTPDARRSAQEAWISLMEQWEQAELLQVGPAAPEQYYPEVGQGLRDHIYSWPRSNPCRVDQELVKESYKDPKQLRELGATVYGLDALEYLLFSEITDDAPPNACAPLAAINAEGTWKELGEEIHSRRAEYAQVLAEMVAEDTRKLNEAWNADEGGFIEQWTRAGEKESHYGSPLQAINDITDGLFYLDQISKDLKVAGPAGLSDNCTDATCPNLRESHFANISLPHLEANLKGFRRVYHGGGDPEEDTGFDDLLVELDEEELDDDIQAAMDQARSALEAVKDPTLVRALDEDPGIVREAHAALAELTGIFKGQFLEALSLSVPDRAAADND